MLLEMTRDKAAIFNVSMIIKHNFNNINPNLKEKNGSQKERAEKYIFFPIEQLPTWRSRVRRSNICA